ncbi:hypothetical protein OG866_40405 [Streptomyces sp. NBC_00663]|uniref:hypothetical protein n=1 Tax=Streptomyces sp. NBC_00663 TaxID=2975801 RepID=UPI002E33A7E6|nr:hypothetical protein [Streptomyces sp. NBC_00663]
MSEFLNDIEGHLLLVSTREEGRTAAQRFTTPLYWLTDAQRAEVEGRFEAEYLALARASWQHTAMRAGRLRDEYEARYRNLRRRLLACLLLGGAAAVGVLVRWPA